MHIKENLIDILSAGGASHVTRSHHTDDESGISATSTFWNLVDRQNTQADKIRSEFWQFLYNIHTILQGGSNKELPCQEDLIQQAKCNFMP